MKTQVTFSFFMALALFPSGTVAPFPKCSPFVFVNKLVESDKVAWLLEGLPGHPVPDCNLTSDADVSLEDFSVIAYVIGNPKNSLAMLKDEYRFIKEKLIPRVQALHNNMLS